jgi:branched-subunit amino acid aminotransferase/4-amino-4-deoxychorismate lyase
MSKNFLWLDGEFVPTTAALLESLTPGVLKAKGVFETMSARNGKVALFAAHLKRMSRGLNVLNLSRPKSFPAIPKNISQLLKVNRLKNARVRLMVWQKGGRIHAAIVAEPLQRLSAQQYKKGFTATLINGHRRDTSEPVKSLDYGIFRESLKKARAAGFDEALLVNRANELVEGSRTNIFLVRNNVLLTPPVTSGCLPGVMRQRIIEAARRFKLRCAVRTLTAADLFGADEAFVTNALLGIMPLTHLGSKQIATGKPGSITLQLRQRLSRPQNGN